MDSKAWYLSKTMWAGVVAMVLGIATLFGANLESEQENIVNLLMGAAQVIAGVVALIGRWTAKTSVTLK